MKVSTEGGTPETLFQLDVVQGVITDLAVYKNRVYWLYNLGGDFCGGYLASIPVNGGDITILVGGLCQPFGMALDEANIYWAEYGANRVSQVPIEGGDPAAIATGQYGAYWVAVGPTGLYWTNTREGVMWHSLD
jgi:hypothetical protein